MIFGILIAAHMSCYEPRIETVIAYKKVQVKCLKYILTKIQK